MLYEFVDQGEFGKVAIYLTSEQHRKIDEEMAEFLLRELIRGNL
jgi:hypothetical protein